MSICVWLSKTMRGQRPWYHWRGIYDLLLVFNSSIAPFQHFITLVSNEPNLSNSAPWQVNKIQVGRSLCACLKTLTLGNFFFLIWSWYDPHWWMAKPYCCPSASTWSTLSSLHSVSVTAVWSSTIPVRRQNSLHLSSTTGQHILGLVLFRVYASVFMPCNRYNCFNTEST